MAFRWIWTSVFEKSDETETVWPHVDSKWCLDDVFVGLKNNDQKILHGSLAVQPRYLDNQEFEDFLLKESSRSSTRNAVPWWKEFWQSKDQYNCSLIATRNERNVCMEMVLRTVYDTYIRGVHFKGVDFKGLTGRVSFDQFGDPISSAYDIVHFQDSDASSSDLRPQVKRLIGSWEKGRKHKLQLNDVIIKWNTMSSQTASPVKPFCHDDYISLVHFCQLRPLAVRSASNVQLEPLVPKWMTLTAPNTLSEKCRIKEGQNVWIFQK